MRFQKGTFSEGQCFQVPFSLSLRKQAWKDPVDASQFSASDSLIPSILERILTKAWAGMVVMVLSQF